METTSWTSALKLAVKSGHFARFPSKGFNLSGGKIFMLFDFVVAVSG